MHTIRHLTKSCEWDQMRSQIP
uniref:Uncharacterized protein n=1 Tax=Anguilla anguilla TaxID=7936 RepID=A0A0E9SUZ7_ANGAN